MIMETIICNYCSKSFQSFKYLHRRYCCMDCKNKDQLKTKVNDCKQCGRTTKGTVNYPRKYCSAQCCRSYQKANGKGERVNLSKKRRGLIKQKYNNRCLVCKKEGEDMKPLQIHHVDDNPRNNSDDNLTPLCVSCHRKTQKNIKGTENYISTEWLKTKVTNFINKY